MKKIHHLTITKLEDYYEVLPFYHYGVGDIAHTRTFITIDEVQKFVAWAFDRERREEDADDSVQRG